MTFAALCARAALATALVSNLPAVMNRVAAQETVKSDVATATAPVARVGGTGSAPEPGWMVISTPAGHRLVRVSPEWMTRRSIAPTATPVADGPATTGGSGEGAPGTGAPLSGTGRVGIVGGEAPPVGGVRPTLLGAAYTPELLEAGMVAPAAPTGLLVQPGADGGNQLSWQDQSTNETAFEVMRERKAGPNWNRATTLRAERDTAALVDNPGNGEYRYRVRSVNGAGASAYTPWATRTIVGQAPTGPTQTAAADLGNGSEVRVTWADNSTDETSFELERQTQSGSLWSDNKVMTASADQTSYTDAVGLGTHRYRVRAVSSGGASAYSAWSTVTVAVSGPAAPTNVQSADLGNGSTARVTWTDNSTNESGFELQRQTEAGAVWGATVTMYLGANVTVLNDSAGVGTHRYRVRSTNAYGASAYTAWAVGAVAPLSASVPAAPSGAMAADIGNRRALVSWTDNSTNETGFEIERSPAFSTGKVTVGAGVVGYVDQSGPGSFSYRVRATGASGSSAYSAWASVTVAEVAPAAPTNVQGGASGDEAVALNWADNSNNESGFRVERQTQNGTAWGEVTTLMAPADATSLVDTAGNGTHRYRVAATNFAGDSEFSTWVVVSVTGGWTVFTPSPDTRIVYVSSSTGNDANNGLSEATAKRTITEGYRLMRQGYPDWLLLKRGDTWVNETLGYTGGTWEKSGRNAQEPMMVSSYGSSPARPMLKMSNRNGIEVTGGGFGPTVDHLAFVGIEFYAHTRNPSDPAFINGSGGSSNYTHGIRFVKAGNNILLEDCRFSYFGLGILFQPPSATTSISNVKIRRCVINNCYATNAHSQGIFATGVNGMLIEECVWDHNGWNDSVTGGHATIFNRNLYLSQNTNLVCRGNIDANGSSGGMQMRRGGLAERNLYLNNPQALGMGHPQNDPGFVGGTIRHNVVLGSRNCGSEPRGFGIGIGARTDGIQIYENIIAMNQLGTGNVAGLFIIADEDQPTRNVTIRDNIVYRWDYNGSGAAFQFRSDPIPQNVSIRNNTFYQKDGGLVMESSNSISGTSFSGNRYWSSSASGSWFRVISSHYNFGGWSSMVGESGGSSSQPSFPNPDRDISTYMASLGGTPSLEGFLVEARKQSRSNWRTQYTADAVGNYIREGFGLPALP